MIRHHSGIYFVRKTAGQGPIGSSEAQKLIENNQNLVKANHELNNLNTSNSETIHNYKSKIEVRLPSITTIKDTQIKFHPKNIIAINRSSNCFENVCDNYDVI